MGSNLRYGKHKVRKVTQSNHPFCSPIPASPLRPHHPVRARDQNNLHLSNWSLRAAWKVPQTTG